MKGRADDAGPDDPIINPSSLVEGVLTLLEEAGAPTELNDQVVKLIEAWESSPEGVEAAKEHEASLLDQMSDPGMHYDYADQPPDRDESI